MRLDRLTIMLPWPDKSLMPNRKNGRHWGNTQAAKVRARQDGYYAALASLGTRKWQSDEKHPIRVTYVSPDAKKRDLDNLLAASKAFLDGIAQALGIDDSRFCPVTLDRAQDALKQGFVKVEIGQ
jgi:crossover junction endodeoxyribonuclease RusA